MTIPPGIGQHSPPVCGQLGYSAHDAPFSVGMNVPVGGDIVGLSVVGAITGVAVMATVGGSVSPITVTTATATLSTVDSEERAAAVTSNVPSCTNNPTGSCPSGPNTNCPFEFAMTANGFEPASVKNTAEINSTSRATATNLSELILTTFKSIVAPSKFERKVDPSNN